MILIWRFECLRLQRTCLPGKVHSYLSLIEDTLLTSVYVSVTRLHNNVIRNSNTSLHALFLCRSCVLGMGVISIHETYASIPLETRTRM